MPDSSSGASPDAAAPGAAPDGRPLLFISDLHLGARTPHTTAALLRFLCDEASKAGGLYILGDFFEVWIGDDAAEGDAGWAWSAEITAALRSLAASGTPVHLMHGNRDFLLGARYARLAGAALLRDPSVLEAFGWRIVLSHGDALCTDDKAYQRFRAVVRMRWLQSLYLALPLSWRQGVSAWLRGCSKGGRAAQGMMPWHDVNAHSAAALLAQTGCATLIHGHTHRPGRGELAGGERWVLTDWDLDHGERAGYLRLDETGLSYHALP
ncbi:MAG: UDP-2,3-diacylglucosamine diphosphatase [Candidatus Protistobacter heckmanni]|nr:UDP-2,3-diacylglucosamine diphosphatase [Candidatus Protistobacter heckmanni]